MIEFAALLVRVDVISATLGSAVVKSGKLTYRSGNSFRAPLDL